MRARPCLAILLVGCWIGTGIGAEETRAPELDLKQYSPTRFGEVFPAATLRNLNPDAGPSTIDLGTYVGKRPVVLFYWIAGNPRADQMFRELQDLVLGLEGQRVALLGVLFERTGRDAEQAKLGVAKLGLRVPVLADEGFQIGQRLRIQSVPNVTLLDAEGRLRLTNGAALAQQLEYKMTIAGAIQRVGQRGTISTYGYLPMYYPAKELIGKSCPDFKAASIRDPTEQQWSGLLVRGKLNLLIFWSVDCPHCRTTLPEINAWLRENMDGVNVISAARVTSDAMQTKTREFCEQSDFAFDALIDRDGQISDLYQVTTTPTFVIIRPDGVIEDVLFSGGDEFRRAMERSKRGLSASGAS